MFLVATHLSANNAPVIVPSSQDQEPTWARLVQMSSSLARRAEPVMISAALTVWHSSVPVALSRDAPGA